MRVFERLLLVMVMLLAGCEMDRSPPAPLTLESLRGRWVVVNYWATWCAPCIREIPELNALGEQYPQVAVLGVNYDGVTGPELEQQLAALGINFPILEADPASELAIARPVVLPTTLILDPDGRLRDTLVGPQTLDSLALATGQKKPAQRAGTEMESLQ